MSTIASIVSIVNACLSAVGKDSSQYSASSYFGFLRGEDRELLLDVEPRLNSPVRVPARYLAVVVYNPAALRLS